MQELLGHNDLILALVCKRFHFCHINSTINVDTLGLLRKYHWYAETSCNNAGNPNAGCFNGQNLGDPASFKPPEKFLSQLTDKLHVNLVIDKAVNLEHIARQNSAIRNDTVFQQFHRGKPPRFYFVCHRHLTRIV